MTTADESSSFGHRANLRINCARLLGRISELANIGAIEGGGVCRLALTPEDKLGRDQVVQWMRELQLDVSIDEMGNVVGTRPGIEAGAPVMTGSHIDTVRTGGRYDGNLGVLAGLEVVQTLNDLNVTTVRPIAVAFFTNEEGARFAPDMMGSMVHQGHFTTADMLKVEGIDGVTVGDALEQIEYRGPAPCPAAPPAAFVELHVEQGPVLEQAGTIIGAVTGVQGISWTELVFDGQSNHAGTTPMHLRHDAGYAAGEMVAFVRQLAADFCGRQVATVGALDLVPNLVNVIAKKATLTVDLRNTDEALLQRAETLTLEHAQTLATKEGLQLQHRKLARFEPVQFDDTVVSAVEQCAAALGLSVMRMPSGAGHDAQSFAPNCPTGMIFVPSVGGISHNVAEFTHTKDIEAGANALLLLIAGLAGVAAD
jgi:N-carbamoyl-L-amino-acid hydrolase